MTGELKSLKWYKSLVERKGRLTAGAFLVEGERAVTQVKRTNPEAILEIVTAGSAPVAYRDLKVRILNEAQFKSISTSSTPQGILAVVQSPPETYSSALPDTPGNRVLLLEDIQDPGNAGTLIRTAVAFGYDGIIMTENGADPLSPKCVQSTAGTVLSVWIRRTKDFQGLINELKNRGYKLAATVLDGTEDPEILKAEERLILALGNEASGLSDETIRKADRQVRVPINGEKAESLNVAACGAICMYLSVR